MRTRFGDDRAVMRDTSADQIAVRDLVLSGMRERWSDAYDPSVNPDLDDIWINYVEQDADVVVVEFGAAIIATGILCPEPDHGGRIRRMSTAEEHRRQGYGRQVVQELLSWARHRGMVEVVVRTDTPWASALALYHSCGFVETDRDDTETDLAIRL
jgi:GNAT superfamily N-acetyltransferase